MKANKVIRYDKGDFLALEAHLAARHAGGARFAGVRFGGRLVFEPAAAEEYTYRLDHRDRDMDEQTYRSRAAALGWELCGTLFGWQCLRRPGQRTCETEEEQGLFHSAKERAAWCRRRVDREILIGVAPMVVCVLLGTCVQNTPFAAAYLRLTVLLLIAALAVGIPGYQTRMKLGRIMTDRA